jgi:hypothetical protein
VNEILEGMGLLKYVIGILKDNWQALFGGPSNGEA